MCDPVLLTLKDKRPPYGETSRRTNPVTVGARHSRDGRDYV